MSHFSHQDHAKIYKDRCTKKAIPMHPRALPKEDASSLSRQGTLDGIVVSKPRIPEFTTQGLLDYAVEFAVSEDQVSSQLCSLDS